MNGYLDNLIGKNLSLTEVVSPRPVSFFESLSGLSRGWPVVDSQPGTEMIQGEPVDEAGMNALSLPRQPIGYPIVSTPPMPDQERSVKEEHPKPTGISQSLSETPPPKKPTDDREALRGERLGSPQFHPSPKKPINDREALSGIHPQSVNPGTMEPSRISPPPVSGAEAEDRRSPGMQRFLLQVNSLRLPNNNTRQAVEEEYSERLPAKFPERPFLQRVTESRHRSAFEPPVREVTIGRIASAMDSPSEDVRSIDTNEVPASRQKNQPHPRLSAPEPQPSPIPEVPERIIVRPNLERYVEPSAFRPGKPKAEAPPAIQVTIGRVEVRAMPPQSAPSNKQRVTPQPPVMSLDEYLRQRAQGGKS